MITSDQALAGKTFSGGRVGAKQKIVRVIDGWLVVSQREGTEGFYRYSSITAFVDWINRWDEGKSV